MPDWGNAASVQQYLDEMERREQERMQALSQWRQGEQRTAGVVRPTRDNRQDAPYAPQMVERQAARPDSSIYAEQIRQRQAQQQAQAMGDYRAGERQNYAQPAQVDRQRTHPQLWRDPVAPAPSQVSGPVGQSGLGQATPVQAGGMAAPTVTAPSVTPVRPMTPERWRPTWEMGRGGEGETAGGGQGGFGGAGDAMPAQPEVAAMGGGALWDKWVGGAVDWWRESAAGQAFAQRQDALMNPEKQPGYVDASALPSMTTKEGWGQYGLMAQQAGTTSDIAAGWLKEQRDNADQPDWFRRWAGGSAMLIEATPENMRGLFMPEWIPGALPLLGAMWSKWADRADDIPVYKGALVAGGTAVNAFQAGDDTLKITPLPGKPEYTVGQFLSGIGHAIWENPLLIVDPLMGGRQLHEAKTRWMNAYSKAAGGQPSVNGSPGQWALLNVYGAPETVKKTYDDLMLYQNRAGVIANYQQQAQQAQANGDALQAAQLGAEAEWWKNARPVDIVDKHTELLPEIAYTMLFDWTNLIGFGFDLAKLGPQTRRMAAAMKTATQSEGTVLKALDEAVATTRALQDANGNTLLAAQKAGAAAQFVGLTNEARATTEAANLFTFFTQLLGDVKRSDDARLLIEAATSRPRELITGLQGLGGLGAEVLQADGTFKVGAGVFSTRVIEAVPTLMEARATLMNLPSLQAETFNPMHALAEIHDALFASAYRVHGLADWAMPQGTKSVRVAAGEVSVAAQAGAERAPAAVLEYVDEGGNVISRSKPMGAAEATGEANQLNQWIATGRTEAPEYSALRAPDRLMRGFMSSVFLNLMPGHWVRNAASGVGHLVTDGVMTFEPTSKLVGEVANQFGGALPLTWMRDAFQGTAEQAAAASARAMGAPASGSFWDFLGKNNPLSRMDAAGSRIWTGGAAVAGGRVPTGEMNMRLRGFTVPFRRGLREEWGKVARRQLEPMLMAMGMEKKQARKLIGVIVDAAVMGNKREILPAVRRFLDGTASSVDMNALGLANGSISPDAYRTIRQVLDVYATNGDRAAAERAINEALDAEQLLFAQILADAPAQPGRQAFTQLENVQDYAELLRDVEHAARKAGADPEQATAPIKEMIAQFGQAEQQGYQALLAAAAETPTPQVRALLFDTWAQIYDAKIAARQRQGELARAAMEDPGRWMAYPQEVARVWGEFFQTQERLFAEALGLMPEAAAGRYVSTAPAGSHGLLEKLAAIDIDQARAQMGQVPKGLLDPEYQQIINAGRSFQDQAASTMYTMALRYADDIDAFDHVISAELDVRRMAAAAAAARAEIAAKFPDLKQAAARKQYYKEMSEMWGDFWFATSARYHAASMAIATDFVMRRLAPDATFVEPWADPFGRTLTLLEPVETGQGRRWRVLDMDKKTVADDLIPDDQVPAEAKAAWEQAMSGPKVRAQAQQMVEQVHQEGRPTTYPAPNAGGKPRTVAEVEAALKRGDQVWIRNQQIVRVQDGILVGADGGGITAAGLAGVNPDQIRVASATAPTTNQTLDAARAALKRGGEVQIVLPSGAERVTGITQDGTDWIIETGSGRSFLYTGRYELRVGTPRPSTLPGQGTPRPTTLPDPWAGATAEQLLAEARRILDRLQALQEEAADIEELVRLRSVEPDVAVRGADPNQGMTWGRRGGGTPDAPVAPSAPEPPAPGAPRQGSQLPSSGGVRGLLPGPVVGDGPKLLAPARSDIVVRLRERLAEIAQEREFYRELFIELRSRAGLAGEVQFQAAPGSGAAELPRVPTKAEWEAGRVQVGRPAQAAPEVMTEAEFVANPPAQVTFDGEVYRWDTNRPVPKYVTTTSRRGAVASSTEIPAGAMYDRLVQVGGVPARGATAQAAASVPEDIQAVAAANPERVIVASVPEVAASAPLTRPESMRARFAPGDQVQLPNGGVATVQSATATSVKVETTKAGKTQVKQYKPENLVRIKKAKPAAATPEEGMRLAAEVDLATAKAGDWVSGDEVVAGSGLTLNDARKLQRQQGTESSRIVKTGNGRYAVVRQATDADVRMREVDAENSVLIRQEVQAARDYEADQVARSAFVERYGGTGNSLQLGDMAQVAKDVQRGRVSIDDALAMAEDARQQGLISAGKVDQLRAMLAEPGAPGAAPAVKAGDQVTLADGQAGTVIEVAPVKGRDVALVDAEDGSIRVAGLYDSGLEKSEGVQAGAGGATIEVLARDGKPVRTGDTVYTPADYNPQLPRRDRPWRVTDATPDEQGRIEVVRAYERTTGEEPEPIRINPKRLVKGDADGIQTADTAGIDQAMPGVVAGEPANDVPGVGGRGAGYGDVGGEGDAGSVPFDGGQRADAGGSLGAGEPDVDIPAQRGGAAESGGLRRPGRGDGGRSGLRPERPRDQLPGQPKDDPIVEQRPVETPIAAPVEPAGSEHAGARGIDFVISKEFADEHLSSYGGPKARFRKNLDAIKLAKRLMQERRAATPAEQQILAQFSGWGHTALAQTVLKKNRFQVDPAWHGEWDALKEALTDAEWDKAMDSTINAHYTEPGVVRAMWRAAERLGIGRVNRPRVLEPAIGAGVFFGAMPPEIAARSFRTGTDMDTLTAVIAGNLYQNADIRNVGFERLPIADNSQHLTITNVPFWEGGVFDPEFDQPGMRFLTKPLHNYFFAKAMKKTAPGGIVMAITSRYTMDADKARHFRTWMHGQADLLAAVRLPDTAFEKNAGTSVVTDLLIFRKRRPGETAQAANWLDLVQVETPQGKVWVNRYFADNPDNVLGQHELTGTMRTANAYTVKPREGGGSIEEMVDQALAKLPANVIAQEDIAVSARTAAEQGMKDGTLVRTGGTVQRVVAGELVDVADTPKRMERLNAMLDIREAALEVKRIQTEGGDDAMLDAALKKLNRTYDAFAKKYANDSGPARLNSTYNKSMVAGDNDFLFVQGLEDVNGQKTDFFRKRTMSVQREGIEKAETALDALTISQRNKARLDMEYMAALTGKSEDELAQELGERVFYDPVSGWVTREEYLSGTVRSKLRSAEQAAAVDPGKYGRNVEALKAVLPPDADPAEMSAQLGSPWIPEETIAEWIEKTVPSNSYYQKTKVKFIPSNGQWVIEAPDIAKRSSVNTTEYAVIDDGRQVRATGLDMIEDLLNQRATMIYDRVLVDGEYKRVFNGELTAVANSMRMRLQDEFKNWLWDSGPRVKQLVDIYTDTFKDYVRPVWDGEHLSFPGMSPDFVKMLRETQRSAIWRALQSGNLLIAHGVGAGKTLTMVGTAMEMRRMGLAQKPLIVTPKRVVNGFAAQFRAAYPGAKILVPSKADFEVANRGRLMARIATGDWDAVIISVEQMNSLPVRVEAWSDFIGEQIRVLDEYMDAIAQANGKDSAATKELAKARKRLQEKLDKKIHEAKKNKDQVLFFEDLGIDALFVDEAHKYKNLWFATRQGRVKGVPRSDSDRAFDMFLKIQQTRKRTGGRNIVFATATPISNSVAEAYTLMRYLMPDALRRMNIEHFDSWSAMFGNLVEAPEMKVTGSGLKMERRYRSFMNVPALRDALYRVMDVVRTEDVPGIKLPKSDLVMRIAPRDEATETVIRWLDERVEAMFPPPGSGERPVDPSVDNMAKLTSEMRAAAVYPQWYFPELPESPTSKINNVVSDAYDEYVRMASQRGTQLIFCDVGTPGGAFGENNAYDMMKRRMVAKGIPANQIAYVQDFKSDAQIMQLMRDMNEGNIRILIGSRSQMAEGLNIQTRLTAVHHVDVPLRPDMMIQADGRAIRHGNLMYDWGETVKVFRHGQEPFDSFIYALLENKAKSFYQLMGVGEAGATMEELDDITFSFAEIKALLTGDPRFMRQIELDAQIKQMGAELKGYQSKRGRAQMELAYAREGLNRQQDTLKLLQGMATQVQRGEKPLTVAIGGRAATFEKRGELIDAVDKALRSGKTLTYRGFDITYKYEERINPLNGTVIKADQFVTLTDSVRPWLTYNQWFDQHPTTRSIDNLIDDLPDAVSRTQQKISQLNSDIEELRKTASGVWAKQAEYEAAQQEYRTITSELMAKGNAQASGRQVTETGSEVDELGLLDKMDEGPEAAAPGDAPMMAEGDIPFGAAGIMLRPGVPVELKALWAKLRQAMGAAPSTRVQGRPKHNFGGMRDAGPLDLFDVMQRNDRRVAASGNLRQPTVGDAAAFRVEDIDQLRRRLLQELDQVGQAPMTLTNQQKMQVLGAVQGMLPQYDSVLAGVTKGAQAISDFAMLDYGKVHGFDTALALQTPYHFWFTRSAKNWLERSLLKPSVLASYLRIKRAIDEQNERERMPQRMGGTVGVPGTPIRIGNPYNLLIPYSTLYELNDFDEPTPNPNALQKYIETARTLGFGLNPLYDSIYKMASGRGQEIQAGDFVPQYRMLNYAYKAMTGNDLPGAGDEYDPYRDARTLARMVQAGQIDEQTARWLMDRIMQRAQGVQPLPEEAAAERQAWAGILKQAAMDSGFERMLPLVTRSLMGLPAYQMPQEELAIRQMQETRRGLGYGPENAFGSQAAVDAFDAQSGYDQVQGAWMGKDALIPQTGEVQPVPPTYPYQQPYQPTRPGVAAVDAEKKAAKAQLQQEMDAAVTAALEANPNMKSAELKAIKQPYRDAIDELDAQYPSATNWAEQGPRDFYGNMNPEELLQSAQQGIVYQALDELAGMKPGEGASAAEWDAYNAALEARVNELMGDPQALSGQVYGRPVDVAPNSTLPPRINGEIPAPYSPLVAGTATTAMQPGAAASAPTAATPEARALIDQVLGGNSTPAETAYWDRRDAQFAANEATWAQRKAAVYATFGQPVGEIYEGYLALPSGSQARKEYKAAHPELRAVSLFAYHPQEYGQLQEMFGAEGIMAWAKLPPASDSKARSAYYDANPAAFLVQAWVYGRPGKQDEQDTAADEAFAYNFGADFATAVEMFGANIWDVVATYRRGWDKATKSAYYKQNPQLSPFFDWWYGNLDDRASVSPYANVGRGWGGGGGGGGGWGGGGGGGYVRMPRVDPRYIDRNLLMEERDIRRWRPQESNMADLSWLQAGSLVRPKPIQKWRRERLW